MQNDRVKQLIKLRDIINRSIGLMIEEASGLPVDVKMTKETLLDLSVLLMEIEENKSGGVILPNEVSQELKVQIAELLDRLDESE